MIFTCNRDDPVDMRVNRFVDCKLFVAHFDKTNEFTDMDLFSL